MKVINLFLFIFIVSSFFQNSNCMDLQPIKEALNDIESNIFKKAISDLEKAINEADINWFKDRFSSLIEIHPILLNQKFKFKVLRKKYINGKVWPFNHVVPDLNLYALCFAKMAEVKIFQKNSDLYCKYVEILALFQDYRALDKLRQDAYTANFIQSYYDNYPEMSKQAYSEVRIRPDSERYSPPKKLKLNEVENVIITRH